MKWTPNRLFPLTRKSLPLKLVSLIMFIPFTNYYFISQNTNADHKMSKLVKRVPKGMSDYQACWIPDIEELDEDEDDDDMEDDDDGDNESDFMSCNSNENSDDEFEKNEQPEEFDDISVSEAPVADDKYDEDLDLHEESETFEKIKQARIDQMWPDEIDTPMDTNARTRFQKYRGLESFR